MGQSKPILLVVSALTILGCSDNDSGNYVPFSADGAIQAGDALPPPQVDGGAQPGPDSAPKQPLQASCNPLQEASCPAGQRCGLTTSGAASCFYSAPGDAKPGASCGAAGGGDNCVDGHVCLSASASQTICARICDAAKYTGCSRSESCNVPINATYNACSPSCDLLTSDGCPANGTCGVWADSTGAVYKGCAAFGSRQQGESCGSSSPCARNHSCVYWSKPPYASGFICRQHCDLDGKVGPACPGNTTCGSPPNELNPFGAIDRIGVCR